MYNYNHLFYFYTVARLGGIMKAAQYLHIAQPSLSTQIKALEAHTHRILFKKVGRGLALTQDGEVLYSICRKMFDHVEDLHNFLLSKESRMQKRIRIGVGDELERPFVVNLIQRIFRTSLKNQKTQVSMRSGKHRVLLEQLRWRELDVLLSNHSAHGDDFTVLAEIPMPVIAVAAPKVVKPYRKSTARETLAKRLQQLDLGLVLPMEDQKLRVETEIYLQKARIRQTMVFESDILAAVVRATVEGLGVAFLPKPYIQKELTSGSLVKLNESQKLWTHSIYQIIHKKRQLDFINTDIRDYFRIYKDKT
ncbi:LysR family transcriptional regulator [Oligoflexus tunisiensis]|uniref:LysR family transcriptional regulator n=1 Tax=Oligoflexus tunisiensis TaxID=708132 RepID=UPI00114D200E|nr:LysR family transcriptional regulator [Oligoflexus tunisiensis]